MSKFHPWHDAPVGNTAPDLINAIIEIPRGGRAKYEIDKESGLLILDRVLYSAVYYPANYGFIPRSFADDGDPLDILVLSQEALQPMCLVPARILGVMRMLDQEKADDKIIAVAHGDPAVSHFSDMEALPGHLLSEVRSFFEDYKKLERKEVRVEDFQSREIALQIVNEALDLYQREILPGQN